METNGQPQESSPQKHEEDVVGSFWACYTTPGGASYYYNYRSRESTWQQPVGVVIHAKPARPGPPIAWKRLGQTEWKVVLSDSGEEYFYNNDTKKSSWVLPPEVQAQFLPSDLHPPTAARQPTRYSSTKSVSASGLHPSAQPSEAHCLSPSLQSSLASSFSSSSPPSSSATQTAYAIEGGGSVLASVKRKLGEEPNAEEASSPSFEIQSDGGPSLEAAYRENESDSTGQHAEDMERDYQQRVATFTQLLREQNLTPFSSWDKELPKLCFDPRFKVLPKHSDRRAIFENYVKNIKHEERSAKRQRIETGKQQFQGLLEEHISLLKEGISFEQFCREVGEQNATLPLAKRKKMFNAKIAYLQAKKEEGERRKPHKITVLIILSFAKEKRVQQETTRTDFINMLKGCSFIESWSSWNDVKERLRGDSRYEAVRSSREREELFLQYIRSISKDYEKKERKQREEASKRERERQVQRRRDQELREINSRKAEFTKEEAIARFQTLLSERVRDYNASWRKSRSTLESDSRFSHSLLSLPEKEQLFRAHTASLLENIYSDFDKLLIEMDLINFTTKWEEAVPLLEKDARFKRVPSDETRQRRFAQHCNVLHSTARKEFLQLLSETKSITSDTSTHGPKYEALISQIRSDKRYKQMECSPEERQQLLHAYLSRLTQH
ncbi:FF domain-containing protein [Balamuthia mandrillaris]